MLSFLTNQKITTSSRQVKTFEVGFKGGKRCNCFSRNKRNNLKILTRVKGSQLYLKFALFKTDLSFQYSLLQAIQESVHFYLICTVMFSIIIENWLTRILCYNPNPNLKFFPYGQINPMPFQLFDIIVKYYLCQNHEMVKLEESPVVMIHHLSVIT